MIIAILQARMSSTRLPGKVLKEVDGDPMLLKQINRILNSKYIDKLIVATTTEPEDKEIMDLCIKNNINFYCGSRDNVLERFYNVAFIEKPLHIVRLTGDCPLIDPQIIDKVIENHINSENDYTSNTIIPTYPDGMDVEVMTYDVLKKIYDNADRPSLKEHVTLYINENKELFKIENVENICDQSHIRLTVDEEEDLKLVQLICSQLGNKEHFSLEDIIEVLRTNPNLLAINNFYERNEGLKKSLAKENK